MAPAHDPVLNNHGMTELHLAAYHGELDWVENCIRGGLDVSARDGGGYTPLHWAADMGMVNGEYEAISAALIEAGSDVNAVDGLGRTVLMLAMDAGNENVVRQVAEALKVTTSAG